MAIIANNIIGPTHGIGVSSPSTFTTASITTITGQLYMLCCTVDGTSGYGIPISISGGGVTWNKISNGTDIEVFYGICSAGISECITVEMLEGIQTYYWLDTFVDYPINCAIPPHAFGFTTTVHSLFDILSTFNNVTSVKFLVKGAPYQTIVLPLIVGKSTYSQLKEYTGDAPTNIGGIRTRYKHIINGKEYFVTDYEAQRIIERKQRKCKKQAKRVRFKEVKEQKIYLVEPTPLATVRQEVINNYIDYNHVLYMDLLAQKATNQQKIDDEEQDDEEALIVLLFY
jgi:hypothetical protein